MSSQSSPNSPKMKTSWHHPSLTVVWGPYVRLSPDDEMAIINAVHVAKKAQVITTRSAVQKLSSIFNIEDVDAYMVSLKKETDEAKPTMPPPPQNGVPQASDEIPVDLINPTKD